MPPNGSFRRDRSEPEGTDHDFWLSPLCRTCQEQAFQTGWFVESLITELAIVFVIRTRKEFWRSKPGSVLAWLSLATFLLAVAIPYLPFAGWFNFVVLPPFVMAGVLAITALYLSASEMTKRRFFARENKRTVMALNKTG
ncbi:cation transporting ATPase C-terminal domain-containing protein [Rhizobium ruizarguesonis]